MSITRLSPRHTFCPLAGHYLCHPTRAFLGSYWPTMVTLQLYEKPSSYDLKKNPRNSRDLNLKQRDPNNAKESRNKQEAPPAP